MTLSSAKIKRGILTLYRLIFLSPCPSGLVSWRYILPTGDRRIRLHRIFWWTASTRLFGILGLIIQLWLYLRWILWSGWRSSWRMVRRLGPQIAVKEQIPTSTQLFITLKLSLGWCITPFDVYRFGLYKQPEKALDYVYDRETHAYHACQNQQKVKTTDSLKLLQDKLALENRLKELGIPVVMSDQSIAQDCSLPLARLIGKLDRAFCKTRSGNQGLGAFAAWRNDAGLTGRTFQGQNLADSAAVEKAWQALLQRDEGLIQPLLSNHPLLAAMAEGDEAITVRYISQYENLSLACLSATLEVPAGLHPQTRRMTYAILPIDAGSGTLQPWPAGSRLSEESRNRQQAVIERGPADRLLPHWRGLVEFSHCAHRQFPDLAAIAWDWVITPEGPVLLEGNSGWGTATPQMLKGGFLTTEAASTLRNDI
ncbi:MAG: sugar-transfer associated ATP-grasp domain-containing protein [Methylobacter sp.]